jgi:hypothetical protein
MFIANGFDRLSMFEEWGPFSDKVFVIFLLKVAELGREIAV